MRLILELHTLILRSMLSDIILSWPFSHGGTKSVSGVQPSSSSPSSAKESSSSSSRSVALDKAADRVLEKSYKIKKLQYF